MPVTHCVCHNQPFEQLLDLARRENLSFEQLRDATGCASGCGMCEPYIRVMLRSGQTHFRPMGQSTINRIRAQVERGMPLQGTGAPSLSPQQTSK